MWAQFGLVPPPDGEPADPRHVEAARKRLAIELHAPSMSFDLQLGIEVKHLL